MSEETFHNQAQSNAKADEITEALKNVIDPEIHHNIVDLGLVYEVLYDQSTKQAHVKMTLTTPMCPFGPELIRQTKEQAGAVEGVEEAEVEIVWEPTWDPRTMASEEIKMELGIW